MSLQQTVVLGNPVAHQERFSEDLVVFANLLGSKLSGTVNSLGIPGILVLMTVESLRQRAMRTVRSRLAVILARRDDSAAPLTPYELGAPAKKMVEADDSTKTAKIED